MDHIAVDDELEFRADSSRGNRFNLFFVRAASSLTGRPPVAPVKYKNHNKTVSLVRLGQAAGFDAPEMSNLLSYHDRRLFAQQWFSIILSSIIFLPFVAIVVFGSFRFMDDIQFNWFGDSNFLISILFTFIIPFTLQFFMFFVQGLVIRLVDIAVNRFYAETLCVQAVLALSLVLGRDDVLKYSTSRKDLLSRIHYLSRMTLLLASRYATRSESNQSWVFRHFKEMELYLREHERWAIAPTDSTLADLRRDFRQLAPLYITGQYGAFEWRNLFTAPEISPYGLMRRVLTGVLRFIGIVLPLILMGLYLLRPDKFPFIPPESRKIITLIFISWLLLVLDSSLKLGVVAQLTSLAKGIKDLK